MEAEMKQKEEEEAHEPEKTLSLGPESEKRPDVTQDASTSKGTTNLPRRRGTAKMLRTKKLTNLEVDFVPNSYVPRGVNAAAYSNFISLEVRTKISILEERWNKVDQCHKDHLWSAIKAKFNIPNDDARIQAMKIAGSSFRNFKRRLVQNYMAINKNPCKDFPIDEKTWKQFCAVKSTPEFQAISEQARDHARQNKNPHRLGSRGYVGKEDEWAEGEAQGKWAMIEGISSKRAKNYLRGRSIKVGPGEYVLPDDIQPIADKILEKETQLTEGVWVPEPGEDTLIAVLGPEHPGRTRAVGNVGLRISLPGITEKRRKRHDRADLQEIAQEIQEKMAAENEVKQRQFMEEMEARFFERTAQMEAKFMSMFLAQTAKNDATPDGSPGVRKSSADSVSRFDRIDSMQVLLSELSGYKSTVLAF